MNSDERTIRVDGRPEVNRERQPANRRTTGNCLISENIRRGTGIYQAKTGKPPACSVPVSRAGSTCFFHGRLYTAAAQCLSPRAQLLLPG